MKGKLNTLWLIILGIYASQAPFGKIYKELLGDHRSGALMMGESNAVLDRSTESSTPSISSNFYKHISELGLADIWREANTDKRDYNFYSHRHCCYSRIDLVLVSWGLCDKINAPQIGIWSLSDHAPISVRGDETLCSAT